MTYTTLISTSDLAQHLVDPDWLVVDCRFYLADPGKGWQEYCTSHIPGAVYASLDDDLTVPATRLASGESPLDPVRPINGGRHPLPTVEQAARVFGRLGIGRGIQVVAYDAAGGTIAAARLWWMLRWLGHTDCAVLDGGWQRWLAENRPLASGDENRPQQTFEPIVHPERIVTSDQVEAMRLNTAYRVLDARAYERYLGKNETIDPVAGHIPGARSAPNLDNLQPDYTFKPKAELRQRYQDLLGTVPAERCAVYCGSGVTATHDILAMLHAGLGEARLYPGSWSEWITNPRRPVSTDDQT